MNCPNCRLSNPDSAMRCDCGYDFTTRQIRPESESKDGSNKYKPMGGWLVLIAIQLLRTAFGWALAIVNEIASYSLMNAPYSPTNLTRMLVTAAITFGMLIFNVIVLGRFFDKRRELPRLAITFLTCNVMLKAAALWGVLSNDNIDQYAQTHVGREAIYSLACILYFLRSKRVRATFVH